MNPRWDDLPNPDEVRKQNYMDAREINKQQNEHERRVAANQEKNNGDVISRKGNR